MLPDEIREELSQLHKSAFGWAMACCGRDSELAAEVLQKAYCRILSGDASFAAKSKFATWVFGVIRFVAHEEFRDGQRRQMECLPSDGIAQVPDENISIQHRELAKQLHTALQQLSVRQREVIHLTFYQDMTIQQAADILKISIGSARQHYQRGKEALHRILASAGELEQ